jgi:hypothetical protein
MSRGPGRIERAIRVLLDAHPDLAFVTDELVEHCYPGISAIERKHQVSVLRAAQKVVTVDPDWSTREAENQGHGWVFFNRANVQSYSLGQLIGGWRTIYRSPKRIRRNDRIWRSGGDSYCYVLKDREAALKELYSPGRSYVSYMTPPPPGHPHALCDGMWFDTVHKHIAYRDGDAELRAVMDAQREADKAAWIVGMGAFGRAWAAGRDKCFPATDDVGSETLRPAPDSAARRAR